MNEVISAINWIGILLAVSTIAVLLALNRIEQAIRALKD